MAEHEFSTAELHAYLDEAAPPERIAAIEDALRGDEALRDQLAELVAQRDAGLHSLGEVWRRRRLTCPTREQIGSHLLGVLPGGEHGGLAGYVKFHLEVVGCRWCNASLEDLREQHARSADDDSGGASGEGRRNKYFQSSVGRLKDD